MEEYSTAGLVDGFTVRQKSRPDARKPRDAVANLDRRAYSQTTDRRYVMEIPRDKSAICMILVSHKSYRGPELLVLVLEAFMC